MLIQRINHIVAPGVHPPLLQNAGSTSGGWRSFRSSWQNSNRSKPLDVQWWQAIGNRRPSEFEIYDRFFLIHVDSFNHLWDFVKESSLLLEHFFVTTSLPPKKKISKKGDSILGVIGDSPQTMSDSMGLRASSASEGKTFGSSTWWSLIRTALPDEVRWEPETYPLTSQPRGFLGPAGVFKKPRRCWWLSWKNPSEKDDESNWKSYFSPIFGAENKRYLSCHHLDPS